MIEPQKTVRIKIKGASGTVQPESAEMDLTPEEFNHLVGLGHIRMQISPRSTILYELGKLNTASWQSPVDGEAA